MIQRDAKTSGRLADRVFLWLIVSARLLFEPPQLHNRSATELMYTSFMLDRQLKRDDSASSFCATHMRPSHAQNGDLSPYKSASGLDEYDLCRVFSMFRRQPNTRIVETKYRHNATVCSFAVAYQLSVRLLSPSWCTGGSTSGSRLVSTS